MGKTYILVMSKPLFSAIAHTGQRKLAIEGEVNWVTTHTQTRVEWSGGREELPKLDEQVPRLVSLRES